MSLYSSRVYLELCNCTFICWKPKLLYKKHLYCSLINISCSLYNKSKFQPPRTVTKKGRAVSMAELPFLRQIYLLQEAVLSYWICLNTSALPLHASASLPPHPLCPLLHTSIQRRRCWVTMAACTSRSSCRSPCTQRPRTCRCASCPSGRMACWWPPPPRSRRTPCDWSWMEVASSWL